MVLELRPAHDPSKAYGFVGVFASLKDLSSSIWTWYLDGSTYKIAKVIDLPAEAAVGPGHDRHPSRQVGNVGG